MRIGTGFDVHAFKPGDHLMIGGVRIPFHKAFLAHSDGDVLLHAISDALLGAAGLGDIGRHFPDTDTAFKDADSRDLLRQVVEQLSEARHALHKSGCHAYRTSSLDCPPTSPRSPRY